ncbi:hypothetical protein JCM21714_3139 [Gracilibacillus boraciitolerans JCM 21714]|uniref:DUF378 domain-containing protein n=1 Tax=Gracilibacillus boraciitolerans JCM 21714 TaxID=1298598 RepID=W4VMP0_9BACI|nr:DUF378 domain-containing protein [Gracilibacillus boraciitolerans]GAE94014.1 hypothetical protein JCM21714_3139 [Gracilibacillus boraciitolerans JCM 21714]
MKKLALVLIIVGAINWLLIGLFQFDLVATLFGGGSQEGAFARVIYTIVGIAGLYSITFLFNSNEK